MAQARDFETFPAMVLADNGTGAAWLRRLGARGKDGCDGVMELVFSVHRDLSKLPQTPAGNQFATADEIVRRTLSPVNWTNDDLFEATPAFRSKGFRRAPKQFARAR